MSLPIPDKKKRIPSFEEVMSESKPPPKVPSYDEVMGDSKKKDFPIGSPSGNAPLQSGGEDGTKIPKVDLGTPNLDNTVEGNAPVDENIFAQVKYAKELENATKDAGVTGETYETVPDLEKQNYSKKIKEDLKAKGIDADELYDETKDLSPQDQVARQAELLQDRVTNPALYQRKLANLKWTNDFTQTLNKAVNDGNIHPDEYNRLRNEMDSLHEYTGSGDFTNQRGAIQSIAKDIDLYGGEDKDKIKKNFAIEVSKVYGNAYNNGFDKTITDTPESKYLNSDEQLGLQYLKDVAPEKAGQYDRLMIDPKTLKDDPDAERGYNHLKQTLEETGIGLQQNSVTEELNSLKKQATDNGGLSPEQIQRATELEKKQEELTQKRNELDKKYPDRIESKVDDALQEIMGQKISGLNYFGGTAFNSIKNTAQGIWEAVSSPFMSDASNTLRELSIMGETLEQNKIYHKTDINKALQTDTMVIEPELQKQIDAVKNNGVLSSDQKEMQIYRLLKDNTDKFGRVPIKGGKFNVRPSSIMYGLSDIGTSLLPFIALEAATGGGATAGAARKFLSTFTAAAATTFHDEYANALLSGKSQSDAYKEAMGMTAISSLAMAGANTPSKIRAMLNPQTSAGKLIMSMSDDAIEKALQKGTPKGLKAIGGMIKERVNAVPEQFKEGLKTGAQFEGAMTLANEAKHQIYNTDIDREQNFKQSLLGIANFGILGTALGQAGFKSPTELQKSTLVQFGEKPKEYISVLDQLKKDGKVTPAEYDHRKSLIESAETAYKKLPQNLDEKQKSEYLYQTVIKDEATKGKADLPPKQAAEAEKTAMVADHTRGLILEDPTEKQLNDRKIQLEKKLEPKKDAEGKSIEIPEKEKLDMQAELEAINNVIESNKNNVKVEPPKEVPESVPLVEGKQEAAIDTNPVKVELPRQVAEAIPLKEGKDVVVDEGVAGKTINDKRGVKPEGYFVDVAKLNEDGSVDRVYEEAKNPKPISKYNTDVDLFSHSTEGDKIAISDKETGKKIVEANTLKEAIGKLDNLVEKYGGEKEFAKEVSKIKSEQSLSTKPEIKNEEAKVTEDTNAPTEAVTEQPMVSEAAQSTEGEERVTGVKKEITSATRAANNMPKVEFPKMTKDAEALSEAKERIDSGKVNPQEMVDRILKEKSNYKNEGEVMDMQYYAHQLEKQNQELSLQLAEAKTPEEQADIRQRKLQLSDLMDAQTEAAQTAGNQWGKTGNRMQPVINDAGQIFRNNKANIKEAYGGEVPEDVQKKIDAITKERDDAIEQRDKVEAKLKQKMAERGFEELKKKANKTAKNKEEKEKLQQEEQELLKELKKSLKKDFGNLNSGIPIPKETLETLGKLAINYFKQGINGFEALVDKMYDALKDEGISRKDIKDFLATHDPLIAEMETKRLNKKAEIIESKLTPPILDKKGRPSEPTNFAKPSKVDRLFRANSEWVKANQRVANAEFKMKIEKRKALESQKNWFQRGLAWAGRLTRLSVLSGTHVLGKLASAATIGSAVKRIPEQAIGAVYSVAFNGIAKKAPIEGFVNAKSEEKFYKEFFNPKKFLKNAADILKTGSTDLGRRLGSAEYEHVPILYIPTDLHQIIKDPPKRATFQASFRNGLIWAEKNGLDINDPLVINSIENAAYKRAQYEIFQEQNWLSKKFTSYKSSLEKSGNTGSAVKFLVDFLIPVSTVPGNISRRIVTTSPLGLIRGGKEVVQAYRKGIEKLTPDEADHVMQQLKQGTLGTALWLIGWYGYQNFGGLYSRYNPNSKRDEEDLKSDVMMINGKEVPVQTQHALPLEVIQLASTARRVYENYRQNKNASNTEALTMAGLASIGAVAEMNPVIETPTNLVLATQDPKETDKLKEDLGRRLVPQIIREQTDKTKGSEDLKFLQDKELKIVPLHKEGLQPVDEKGKRIFVTPELFKKVSDLREEKLKQAIAEARKNGFVNWETGETIPADKITTSQLRGWLMSQSTKAKNEAIDEVFGEQPDKEPTSKWETNQ